MNSVSSTTNGRCRQAAHCLASSSWSRIQWISVVTRCSSVPGGAQYKRGSGEGQPLFGHRLVELGRLVEHGLQPGAGIRHEFLQPLATVQGGVGGLAELHFGRQAQVEIPAARRPHLMMSTYGAAPVPPTRGA